MEILQTIWEVFTTENETILKITGIPLVFIEAFISMLLFTTILNISSSKNQKLLYVFLFATLSLFSAYVIPMPYNTFINLISCPILVFVIFKTNILKAILAEIIPYIIFVILGSILLRLGIWITNIDTSIFLNIPIYKTISSLLMYFIVFLIYLFAKHFNINITLLENLKSKSNKVLIINFILGIISIILQSYLAVIYANLLPSSILLVNIFILSIYFLFTLYSLSRTNKLEATTQNLEEEKLYNKTLTILHDNIRGFKHDFNNIVQAIGGYVATENITGLKEYYNQLVEDCQKINNLSILNPDIINNPAIYSLLTSKYHTADELGIKINLEVLIDLNSINMKIYELTRILGILLDNAIEASKESEEKIINITMRNDIKQNRQLFIIENTYLNKEIDINKIFEKGHTSKIDTTTSHGLGLWEVRQLLKKNNNLNLHTTKDDKFFKQQLEIYF